jgi:hypothetical protein
MEVCAVLPNQSIPEKKEGSMKMINLRLIQMAVRTLNDGLEIHFFICKTMQTGWMNAFKQTCHGFRKGN